ncbi:MAG: FG-GAP-like repeat-containing protein [Planctomycetota bacterium]|jgi:hypothetical protein
MKMGRMTRVVLTLLVVFVMRGPVWAEGLNVPYEYPTIQAAIDAANDGDAVIVSGGPYNEDIRFKGKNIVVTTPVPCYPGVEDGPIIQGTGTGPVVTFAGSEDTNCGLFGFVITGGNTPGNGGGICGNGTAASIAYCFVRDNHADGSGGGLGDCDGEIVYCIIRDNTATDGGGLSNCDGSVVNCLITSNSSDGDGGAMVCSGNSTVTNCTIGGNSAYFKGGGIFCAAPSVLTMTNSIVWGNSAQFGPQIYNFGGSVAITYSDVQGGHAGEGNIDADPLFLAVGIGNYRLGPGSPCIDAGDNSGVPPSADWDLDGNGRMRNGVVDMGAYEFKGQVHYVDGDATGANDGSSWADAFNYLQDALAAATSGDQIWVAQGTYKPDSNAAIPEGTGEWDAAFQLKNCVGIYGGFPHRAGLGTSASFGVALGELDGDGDLDAFVANYFEANKILLNDGAGGFEDSGQNLGGAAFSYQVALGDIDGDGDLDAFVANDGNPSKVYVNDGYGVFTDSGQALGSGLPSIDVELGDLDGDSDLDAFVANYYGGNGVWLNDGNGIFIGSGQSIGDSESYGVRLGDLDDDGDLDAFVANAGIYSCANKVWLNNGNGTFIVSGQNLGSSVSRGAALGDVDGDGDLDAFTANFGSGNKVWLNDGHASFIDSGQSLGSSLSYAVALGDLDADGDLDGFVANNNRPDAVWLNDGFGFFVNSGQSLGNSAGHDVTLGDLDGDGDLDAFVANDGQPDTVWLNNGLATFTDSNNPQFDERNWRAYETVLSGDLKGNDAQVAEPSELLEEPTRVDNSYHVVTGHNTDETAVLDGFTISGGNFDVICEFEPCGGGGMYNNCGSPTVINCTFTENAVLGAGGGLFNQNESNPTLINCTFQRNAAGNGGAIFGCSPTIANCTFSQNSAGGGGALSDCNGLITKCTFSENSAVRGGALAGCNSVISGCTFHGNLADEHGGAIDAGYWNSLTVENCVFGRNCAGDNGGCLFIYYDSSATLRNCTFCENSATNGRVLVCYTWHPEHPPSSAELTNCILWDGGDEIWKNDSSTISVSYSDVQGCHAGEGNIDADPLFVAPGRNDCHLLAGSPCINAGDPAGDYSGQTDIDGERRVAGGRVDMGADEFMGPIFVDDDAAGDPGPGDANVSDPMENGSQAHPFDAVQEGIDVASDSGWVAVYPGIYEERIDFLGKAITVAGTDGAAIIQAPGNYAVWFSHGEDANSVLKNFVVRNSYGGLLFVSSSPTVSQVTVADCNNGAIAEEGAQPDISNSIFWNNADGDLYQCEARYSCIERGGEGLGNISSDPLFVKPANGDYHLKSEGWRWAGGEVGWTWDEVTSRCIDAGNPGTPLGNEPESVPRDPNNDYGINLRINMGAYGGTSQASIPPYGWALLADVNNDGIVNWPDFGEQAKDWLKSTREQPSDANRDSVVNMMDLALLVEEWLDTTTWAQ